MAQLNDLIVTGNSQLIGPVYTSTLQLTSILAPSTSGGSTYTPGTNGQILKSNGSSVYWAADSSPTITSLFGTSKIGDTNLPVYYNGSTLAAVTKIDTANNLIYALSASSSAALDGDTYIASYADGKGSAGTGTNTFHRRPIMQLWANFRGHIIASAGVTGTTSGNNLTITHTDTSSVSNLTASGRKYVTGLTFDTYGHVTGYTTGTETVTNTDEKVAYVTKTASDIGRYPVVFGNTTGATQTSPGSISIDGTGIIYRPKGSVLELGALELRNNYITLGTWTASQTSASTSAKWVKIQTVTSLDGQRTINLPWFSTSSSTHMNLIGKEGPTNFSGPVTITSAGRIEVYTPNGPSGNSTGKGTVLYWDGSTWKTAIPSTSAGLSLRISGWNAYWG